MRSECESRALAVGGIVGVTFKNKIHWFQGDVAGCGGCPDLRAIIAQLPTLHGLSTYQKPSGKKGPSS